MTPVYILEAAKQAAILPETRSRIEDIQFARVADESIIPTDDDPVHAFSDWNDIRSRDPNGVHGYADHPGQVIDPTMERLYRILEERGIEGEWEDEWSSCYDCGRMVRTSPNSFDWRMFGAIIGEGSLVCGHCIQADPDEYIREYLDNPRKAINSDIVLPTEQFLQLFDAAVEREGAMRARQLRAGER